MWRSYYSDEEEMELRRDDAYKQLEILAWKRANYLSASTKKMLRAHLANFNFSYDWTEDCEELLDAAKTEQRIKAEQIQRFEELEQLQSVLYVDDEADKFIDIADYWERRLTKKTSIKDHCRLTGHRAGLKRNKVMLWFSRGKITQRKLAKCQTDPQPAQSEATAAPAHRIAHSF